jgi:hypothetical protein
MIQIANVNLVALPGADAQLVGTFVSQLTINLIASHRPFLPTATLSLSNHGCYSPIAWCLYFPTNSHKIGGVPARNTRKESLFGRALEWRLLLLMTAK